MEQVYIAHQVKAISALYQEVIYNYEMRLNDRLAKCAAILWQTYQDKNPIACIEINNYHPEYLGEKPAALLAKNLGQDVIEMTIAKEYCFDSWETVQQMNQPLNVDFEMAVDHLLAGRAKELSQLLVKNPSLIHQTSDFGHQATLLHYTASNGVELYRQQVPMNLPALTRILLDAGAKAKATMQVYGGAFTSYQLLTSSAHPKEAGVLAAMMEVFNS